MSWVGLEPTITASERAKIVHALDRSATVTGIPDHKCLYYKLKLEQKWLEYLQRMPWKGSPKSILKHQQIAKRDLGKPRIR
jgi:hypothetical protein